MADVGPLVTIEDYRRALEMTLNVLEEVLSTDAEMTSGRGTYEEADRWLDSCRTALEQAEET